MTPGRAMNEILREYHKASLSNGPFHSVHEGYAVMLEEMDELWDEVKKKKVKRSTRLMALEAKQIGAMALRFMVDMCKEEDV